MILVVEPAIEATVHSAEPTEIGLPMTGRLPLLISRMATSTQASAKATLVSLNSESKTLKRP